MASPVTTPTAIESSSIIPTAESSGDTEPTIDSDDP